STRGGAYWKSRVKRKGPSASIWPSKVVGDERLTPPDTSPPSSPAASPAPAPPHRAVPATSRDTPSPPPHRGAPRSPSAAPAPDPPASKACARPRRRPL